MYFVGCGDSTYRCRASGTKSLKRLVLSTARRDSPCGCPLSAQPIQGYSNCNLLIISFYLRVAPQLSDIHFPRLGIFFLFEKENACKRKTNCARRKASTHRFCAAKLLALKSIGFLMTGKKKARRNAPAFQAFFSQHGAKRLTFKRCLLAFLRAAPLYPRERLAAVHSSRLSISCSAHSPVNSLRSNNTGSCVLLRKPFSPLKT